MQVLELIGRFLKIITPDSYVHLLVYIKFMFDRTLSTACQSDAPIM